MWFGSVTVIFNALKVGKVENDIRSRKIASS